MKKFLTLIAVAAMAFAAQATEWTAADGTETGEYAPVYGYNIDVPQHNQMQYPAAELAGMAAGSEITAVKFYTGTASEVNALGASVKVSLANMEGVTPWSVDGYGYISGDLLGVDVTTVAATVTPAADENGVWTITFDAPFTYTGGALLVDIEIIEQGSWNDTYFYGKEMGAYDVMSVYGYGDTKRGQTVLPKATFTYEGGGGSQGVEVASLREANALEDGEAFTFNGDAVVTICWKGSVYLRDETGYGQIADSLVTFANGQVLNQGWTAKKATIAEGWVNYIDDADLSASGETNAALAAAQKLTTVDESMLNAYVYVENVNKSFLPIRSITLTDGTILPLTGTGNQPATGNYNIYGLIWKNANGLVFEPVAWETYVAPVLRGDVNGDGEVNISDVTTLIDLLLSGETIDNPAADCSLDGNINISDVSVLKDFLLNGYWD